MLNCITVSILSYFPLQIHALRRARGGYIYIYIYMSIYYMYRKQVKLKYQIIHIQKV